ncbi:MAG TPA: hypothetical protein VMW40_06405 [Candidatus Bathyarchaeia archaeon]|nr:hypothetical protein [Candidatus Bathyarchaeia archaeon]
MFDLGGTILILSDRDVEGPEIYDPVRNAKRLRRCSIRIKRCSINADKIYLQDDESVFGHVFISFLSLYIHCKLEQLLKKAELNRKRTPIDLLFKYGKVYHVDLGEHSMISEVPKKVWDLEEKRDLG